MGAASMHLPFPWPPLDAPSTLPLPLTYQVPNGEMTADQLRFMAECIRPYGEDGCADITTRANIQVRTGLQMEQQQWLRTG